MKTKRGGGPARVGLDFYSLAHRVRINNELGGEKKFNPSFTERWVSGIRRRLKLIDDCFEVLSPRGRFRSPRGHS
jgi:hypothetical protein